MNIDKNKLIINDYLSADYEMINALLSERRDIDTLEINSSDVNLDTIPLFINDTNVKSIIINDSNLYYENNDVINIDNLIINNVSCNNFEMFLKFINITKLQIMNLNIEFNCYYLRVLKQLQDLSLININASHLGSLAYLKNLNVLHLNNVSIKNWIFTTKLSDLKTLYLSSEYDLSEIPRLLFEIKLDKEIE